MFELNLSNALALIDKPVWVVTEVRSRNKKQMTIKTIRSLLPRQDLNPAEAACSFTP